MKKQEVLRILALHREDLINRSVRSISVFGSVARDEAREDSDVDLLVDFDPDAHIGLIRFVQLQRYLSQLLDARVDLVTRAALRKEIRDTVLGEAIRAA